MKRMTTLGTITKRIEQLDKETWDELIDCRDLEFEALDTLDIAGQAHRLRPTAQGAIANRLGLPLSYLRRCPRHLQAVNLNHWLRHEPNDQLFIRFDGSEVRAVFTPRYVPVDNVRIMERLFDLGYGAKTRVVCRLDAEFMSLSIPDGNRTFDLDGDRITPGLAISNSEVGLSSVTVSAYFLRLVCTNGLVARTETTSRFRHISATVLDRLPDCLESSVDQLDRTRERFRLSLQSPVENPTATMDSFNQRFQLSEPERTAVLWGWDLEQGQAMFHIVQTYTRAAQHNGLSAESSHRLERVGGQILEMVR